MRQTISAAEWQVMRVLWAGPGRSSQEIVRALQEGFDWQASTIKTLLSRLKAKDYLKMEKLDGKYRYYPLVGEEEQVQEQIETLLAAVCRTKHAHLVQEMLRTASLSQSQLSQIKDCIQTVEQVAPERIDCYCLAGQCSCGQACKGRGACHKPSDR